MAHMARARFPGRPPRASQRRRVRVLDTTPPPPDITLANDHQHRQRPVIESKDVDVNANVEIAATDKPPENDPSVTSKSVDDPQKTVKTRSQQKMQVVKNDSEKSVPVTVPTKKTVTFGGVESCGDTFKSIKKVPLKNHRPLVSIIKKKSAFKSSEHSFHNIVKPAKLTDLGSKTCLDFSTLRAHHNRSPPVKKTTIRFSQIDDEQNSSQTTSTSQNILVVPSDKDGNNRRFVLPSHSAHSSRVIKPNKRFIDSDDGSSSLNCPQTNTKVLKKPKLILNGQNDINSSCYDEAYETCDSSANSNDSSDSKGLEINLNHSQNQSKPTSYFDKSLSLFGSTSGKTLSTSFQDTFVNGLKNAHANKSVPADESENLKSEISDNGEQMSNDHLKDGISHRLLQTSRNISETPCTSDQSSSSTASETSESDDSHATSDSEDSDIEGKTVIGEKIQSPLMSGKVVLREPRLQLNINSSNVPSAAGNDGPFSSFGNQSNPTTNPLGTVTCGVCGAVRFYRFVRQARKFGIYSCESCRKFISKMLKHLNNSQTSNTNPPHLQCLSGDGNCRVPPVVRSQQWKLLRCAYKARCHACWLKMCIKAFQVSAPLKSSLQMMLPPYMRPASQMTSNTLSSTTSNASSPLLNGAASFNTLTNPPVEQENNTFSSNKNLKIGSSKKISEDKEVTEKIDVEKLKSKEKIDLENLCNSRKRRHTRIKVRKKDKIDVKQQIESTKRQKVELKGPRVKHVCRSASIVLGQPLATFPLNDEKNLSDCSDDADKDNKLTIETKDSKSEDLSEYCNSCKSGDKEHSCVDENATDDETTNIVEEMDIVKDEESSDSFDSVILKDMNKENNPTVNKSDQAIADVERNENVVKSESDMIIETISQKRSLKQPLVNVANIKVSSKHHKYNRRRPSEFICTDFWESYDPDEVCNTGWGLISTTPFSVNGVCFLCGSRGKEKLIHCSGCCEMYHPFCIEMNEENGRSWLCPRCVQCSGCGQNGNSPASALCRACRRHFHSDCLIANRTPKYRSDWPQICSSCLKCKSCDSFKVTKFLGNLPFCSACFKLRQKGNYCPLCQGCYQDNDFDSKMMECGWCSRWVHARCEGLSGEGYQLVSALPHSVEYICKQCMPENAQWRNMLGTYLRGKLLNILKSLAKNKNACALLKLTPHKNTPVTKKSCICSSPHAVRKLSFDENSMEDDSNHSNATSESSLNKNRHIMEDKISDENNPNFNMMSVNNSETGKAKGVVHKLQESLLQNQEICISVGTCSAKNPTADELKEKNSLRNNDVNMKEFSQSQGYSSCDDSDESSSTSTSQEFTKISHKCLASSHKCSNEDSNSLSSCQLSSDSKSDEKCSKCLNSDTDLCPSLLDIKSKVNSNEYSSVKDFNKDMLEAISRTSSLEIKDVYKEVFTESFPWFNCELNCLNPSLEIEDENEDDNSKEEELSTYLLNRNDDKGLQKINNDEDQTVPSIGSDFKSMMDYSYEDDNFYDNRTCVLCKSSGEGNPSLEERLLYCGQGDWVHANCALWSAEVFEEIDGSLQNVQSAIARGKMIKCSKCFNKGASVGCCAKNCSETYHFICARNVGCALLDDKRVFCPAHVDDAKDRTLQTDDDFMLSRPVYVELDKKKKKYADPQKVQFLLGSLIVSQLGKIVPSVSDFEDVLIPADFMCARLYWSCKQPWKIVKYTIRTKLLVTEPSPAFDLGVNITLDHSLNPSTVDRILAEIEAWHKSLETNNPSLMTLKKDKSPIKFNNSTNVTLEDYAVKQVMEYMLDLVCKQDQSDETPEEEPQNTADLLPPELKDAIFEDLNHDVLDGISMQDIFPKLMSYEDLIAMDMKNEMTCISDVTKELRTSDNSEENILKLSDDIPQTLHEKLKKGIYSIYNNDQQSSEDKTSAQDVLDEIMNSQNDNTKEIKRNKSDLMLHSTSFRNFTASRTQKSCNLTWNCNALSSIKRYKLPRPGILTRPDPSGNVVMVVDGTIDLISSFKSKTEEMTPDIKNHWQTKSIKDDMSNSTMNHQLFGKNEENGSTNLNELCTVDKDNKSESPEQTIDFYTKMQCSPISQLDGADPFMDDNSDSNSSFDSPIHDVDYKIPQLDGADDASSSSCSESGSPPRDQNTSIFFRTNNDNNTYTMTISGGSVNVTPVGEMLIRPPMDENTFRSNGLEQTVKCDRCHCTYRTKDSYNRHLPTCDMMSTSESESETPKSPESRTLTTLQNAFNAPFVTPTYINQQNQIFESSEQFNISKPAIVGTRRTSVNTRQITINGTIVEKPSPGPPSPLRSNGLDQLKTTQDLANSIAIKNSYMPEPPKITIGQGLISQPQIMVTNLPVSPPRSMAVNGAKGTINQNQQNMPYSICVKPSPGLHTIQPTNGAITHVIPSSGNIQTVFSSNPNQVLTLNPQQNIIQNIQGKTPIMQTISGIPSNQTLSVPVNSLQGLSTSNNNSINTFVRPSLPIQNAPTILMSSTAVPKITSPNMQQKNQVLLPQMNQKSPKKLQQVQPKPIFQATKGRGRTVSKPPSTKRQNKQDKPFTGTPTLSTNGAVIQFQNNGTNQPSIILQQVANPNVMSAYVETLQQPHGSYIATITPQGEFKTAPTHYISQGGILPQAFQIQQTENGGLVAVPSGGIPVILPQGGVGILPQGSLQSQGVTLSSQGNLQTQGVTPILPQGAIHTQNGTIIPQTTIQTQNGTTIIPQGTTLQGIAQGNIQSQGTTLLPAQGAQGATIVPANNMSTSQTIIPQPVLQTQGNTLISQQPGTTIIPQGTILPQGLQFCNDQVLLGSAPTLEMVTDSSGCMYLTTPQPVYYGLETIVQNTVMSSQQFVSTAMQGVLAQNSSFSATTTQVFQASKIEPIVEMPAGYVVVNNVPQDNIIVSQPNSGNSQTLISAQPLSNGNITVQPTASVQVQKNSKNINGPNITIQPAIEKQGVPSLQRHGTKTLSIQPNQPIFSLSPQTGNTLAIQNLPRNVSVSQTKSGINLQPLQTNVIQTGNVPISMSNSQNVSLDSQPMHVHINQPMTSNTIITSGASKIISSTSQLNNTSTMQDNCNTSSQEPTTIHIHQPINSQHSTRSNISPQCWKNNQNFTSASSDDIKNSILTINSNDNQISVMSKAPNNINANQIITNANQLNNSRNFTSFGQPVFNEISMSPKNAQYTTGINSNGNNILNICQSPHTSQNSAILSNNNFIVPSSPVGNGNTYLMTSSANPTSQQNINQQMSHGIVANKESSESITMHGPNQQMLSVDNNINKQGNLNQASCNMHRNLSTPLSDNSTNVVNTSNIIQLPNNMMNLSLQGGKIYQIPISSNNVPHMVINPNGNNMQNQINCNLQINPSNMNNAQNNSNLSNNQINLNHFDQLSNSSSNNYQTSGNINNQLNCLNNQQNNQCHQHQMNNSSSNQHILNISNNQNQISAHIDHQSIGNQMSNNNQIHLNNSSNNHLQIVNNSNNAQIYTNANSNNQNNICNINRQIMNADHSVMDDNEHNFNRINIDGHITNINDKNQLQVANSNCVQQISISNNNNSMNNQMQMNVENNRQNVHENLMRCENTNGQFQINGNHMFLVGNHNNNNNSQINTGSNILHGIAGHFNQPMQSGTPDTKNNSRQSSDNNLHDITSQMNLKMSSNKGDIFGSKISTTIGNSNIDISVIPSEMSESAKLSLNKSNTPVISMSDGNQIGYIQVNGNSNQILEFNNQNRISLSDNINSQIQNINPRNQSTSMITIGQNDITSLNSGNSDSSNMVTKGNDMPSLNISVNSNTNHMSNMNKQINLPQHNVNNNCMNNSSNFSMSMSNIQQFQNMHSNNNSNNNNIMNSISLPAQNLNNSISLPVQSSSSINLPKAPTHQSGIPTNVVNPIPQYMRPMNRVLPIHRDAQNSKTSRVSKVKIEPPKPSPRSQDMPDLNSKDDEIVTNDADKIMRDVKTNVDINQAQKKTELTPIENNTLSETIQTNALLETDKTATLKTPDQVTEEILKTTVDMEKITKSKDKENLSENITKAYLQKIDVSKMSKENPLTQLKSQISSQRKQFRSKSTLENISSFKIGKLPPLNNKVPKDDGPKMVYEISSEDGFNYTSTSLSELWGKVLDAVQIARKQHGLPLIKFGVSQNLSGAHILGLHNNALKHLVEQLPGASRCLKYKTKHGFKTQPAWDADVSAYESFRESPWGTARAGPAIKKSSADMFSWLASPYRDPPPPLNISPDDNIVSRRLTSTTLPIAMRFRHLKETSKHSVGVYRSHIHGRGLFCRRDIEAGEMVIEYAGEVIRAALADQRERRYEAARGGRGVTGCYMFRVDDHLVVDATMKGNAARFINHSCDPNCYSKVVDILGHKHILILALRRIYQGEELTYDYKFPFEEVKIPCTCGSKKCRKYLN